MVHHTSSSLLRDSICAREALLNELSSTYFGFIKENLNQSHRTRRSYQSAHKKSSGIRVIIVKLKRKTLKTFDNYVYSSGH